MPNPHALATLVLTILIFALSAGAVVLGTHRDSLFAEPGRADAGEAR